jgi:DNA-directed RNA polymerase beta' subunit
MSNRRSLLQRRNLARSNENNIERQVVGNIARHKSEQILDYEEVANSLPIYVISEVEFSLISTEYVDKNAVAEITKKDTPIHNINELTGTLYDLRMGALKDDTRCATCSNTIANCPGHLGMIDMGVPLLHPLFPDHIYLLLSITCINCHRMRLNPEFLVQNKLLRRTPKGEYPYEPTTRPGVQRLRRIDKYAEEQCPHCNSCVKLTIKAKENSELWNTIRAGGISEKLDVYKVYELLDSIDNETAYYLGYITSHPRDYVIKKFPVLAPRFRPYHILDGTDIQHHDFTDAYRKIVDLNEQVKVIIQEPEVDEASKEQRVQELLAAIRDIIKSPTSQSTNKKKLSFIEEISNKHGTIRGHSMGKRVDFSGRTVASPGADIKFGWIGVPREMARKLTVPETVASFNIKNLQALLDAGKITYMIPNTSRGNIRVGAYVNISSWMDKFKSKKEESIKRMYGYNGALAIEPDQAKLLKIIKSKRDLNDTSLTMTELSELKQTLPSYTGTTQMRGKDVSLEDYVIMRNLQRRLNATIDSDVSIDSLKPKYGSPLELEIGDKVNRELRNGDRVVINRQPTLHRESMMSFQVQLIDDKVIRMPLSNTTSYNADFDGDELNIHALQSIESIAEMEVISNTTNCITGAVDSKAMIGLIFDNTTASYLITRDDTRVDMDVFSTLITVTDSWQHNNPSRDFTFINSDVSVELSGMERFFTRAGELNYSVYDENNNPHRLSQVAYDVYVNKVADSIYSYLYYNKYTLGGKLTYSIVFPRGLSYFSNPDVLIKDGYLISGRLTKKQVGPTTNSIPQVLSQDFGNKVASEFLGDASFMLNNWLRTYEITVSIADCKVTKTKDEAEVLRKYITDESDKAARKVQQLTTDSKDKFELKLNEDKINGVLRDSVSGIQNRIKEYITENNNIGIMAESGAKGSTFNLIQINGVLGQQKVNGERAALNMSNGKRCQPYFMPGEKHPKARGYCTGSFGTGLSVSELIFHAAAGREGLMDTAVKTQLIGEFQRRLTKTLENVIAAPDGTVRSGNTIIQSKYGGDGFDSKRLEKTSYGRTFVDLHRFADKLNAEYD